MLYCIVFDSYAFVKTRAGAPLTLYAQIRDAAATARETRGFVNLYTLIVQLEEPCFGHVLYMDDPIIFDHREFDHLGSSKVFSKSPDPQFFFQHTSCFRKHETARPFRNSHSNSDLMARTMIFQRIPMKL